MSQNMSQKQYKTAPPYSNKQGDHLKSQALDKEQGHKRIGEQASENELKALIKEALEHDLEMQRNLSEQTEFAELWSRAEQASSQESIEIQQKKPWDHSVSFALKSWLLSAALVAMVWVGIKLINPQTVSKQNPHNELSAKHATQQAVDPVGPSQFSSSDNVVASLGAEHLELHEPEDHLSWLDHDDWSLNTDL